VAQGNQGFAVPGALLDGYVPFGGNGSQNAQDLRGVGPRQMGEVAKGAAVVQVIGRVMGGKWQGLQREGSYDQQHDRKRF
jgi:hypothetical protein